MSEEKKEEKKPKISYQTDIMQGTIRILWQFDTGESGQMNFPLGTEERVIEEALKTHYENVQKQKASPLQTGRKEINF